MDSSPSLEKILISYSEFERLKNIESEYLKTQNSKEKNFELKSDQSSPSTSVFQKGEGTHQKSKKRTKLSALKDIDLSDDDTDVFEHIANIVAKKIRTQEPQPSTSLFQAESSTPLQVEVTSADTSPPISFAQKILKSDENDSFGKKNS